MADRKYYCFCEDNCKFETLTKEQILAAITQAIETHEITNVDTGFVTKIKELNSGEPIQFWLGTYSQYHAIAEPEENVFYIITNDNRIDVMEETVSEMKEQVDNLSDYVTDKMMDISGNITTSVQWGLNHAKNNMWMNGQTIHLCADIVANGDATLSQGTHIGQITDHRPRVDCPVTCQISNSNGILSVPATVTKDGLIRIYPTGGVVKQGDLIRLSGCWLSGE